MGTNDILCASDLSAAAARALEFAAVLAGRSGGVVKVLHVLGSEDAEERRQALLHLNDRIQRLGGTVRVEPLLSPGDPLEEIARESGNGHGMLVLATHGLRGLRQKLFGADILKLVRRVQVPALVVQEESALRLDSGPLVMPVAAHENIARLVDAVITLAKLFSTQVHVYQLHRSGEEASDELLRNKQLMIEQLNGAGIRPLEVNEPSTSPSISFAGPTVEYAARVGASCIAMMSHASKEYRYMADAEKERLLINDTHIPIICC